MNARPSFAWCTSGVSRPVVPFEAELQQLVYRINALDYCSAVLMHSEIEQVCARLSSAMKQAEDDTAGLRETYAERITNDVLAYAARRA